MLLKKIREKVFQKKFLRQPVPADRVVLPFQEWRKCAILCTLFKNTDIEQELENLQHFCVHFSKEVVIICYAKHKKISNYILPENVILVTPEHLNLFGFIRRQVRQMLSNEKFDVLIDVSTKSNFIISQLAASVHAQCKVTGSSDPDMRVFDIHIVRNETGYQDFLMQVKNIFHHFTVD